MGRLGPFFGPVSVCVVVVCRTLLSQCCRCSVSVSPMRLKVFVCFFIGSRVSRSIFEEGLPCTWPTRVMMAAYPLIAKCSREKKNVLSFFLASDLYENTMSQVFLCSRFSFHMKLRFTRQKRFCVALAWHASSSFQLKASHRMAGGYRTTSLITARVPPRAKISSNMWPFKHLRLRRHGLV